MRIAPLLTRRESRDRRPCRTVTYGWGAIPVEAWIGDLRFTTSLFPKDGAYLLPLKAAVRHATGVMLGDRVPIRMGLTLRGWPPPPPGPGAS